MISGPLISIIIPTYNRAHLIIETLNSIKQQSYINWECIIVDDFSTDNTTEIIKNYIKEDSRFRYYLKPMNLLKGANTSRNYGLDLSKGKYINWFDSDDIMHKDFIKRKVEILANESLDFVVSYSLDFDEKGNKILMFEFDNLNKELTSENYIKGLINWVTMDVMVLKSSIKNLRFNKVLMSSQEYNFFSRYLLQNPRGKFIHECLAYRRVHKNSIQEKLKLNEIKRKEELLFNDLVLLDDIKETAPKPIIKIVFKRIIKHNYGFQKKRAISRVQINVLKRLLSYCFFKKAFNYALWIISNFFFGKGYCFIRPNFS
ncbi:glycosyltransferase family 2 protein [Mariniflexile sp.]|uniref:glycosyltransferase family 2 protein n=1 Tax=Mariniflexile sp. TaxID=1979402 RepID=UPI003565C574